MNTRYLITGGCGFLGSNLAAECVKRGAKLCVLDSLSRVGGQQNLDWLKSCGSFDFEMGDIRDFSHVERVIRNFKPDVIFHLAGQVAMTTSIADPRADFEINAGGSLNVLESVRLHCPATVIVYSSTNKVYGDLEWVRFHENATRYHSPDFPEGFAENTPLDFHSPYGCSKGSADQYMLDYARIFNLNTVVFRHSSIFGVRQFSTFDQGWIGWFCQKAMEQRARSDAQPFTVSGNGKQVRDVLFADDAVRCYFAAADGADHCRGQAFNIGGGMDNSLSLKELFALLSDRMGITLRYEMLPPRASDQKVFVADIAKVRHTLGWTPRIKVAEGVDRMLTWMTQTSVG